MKQGTKTKAHGTREKLASSATELAETATDCEHGFRRGTNLICGACSLKKLHPSLGQLLAIAEARELLGRLTGAGVLLQSNDALDAPPRIKAKRLAEFAELARELDEALLALRHETTVEDAVSQ